MNAGMMNCPLCGAEIRRSNLLGHSRKPECKTGQFKKMCADHSLTHTIGRLGKEYDGRKIQQTLTALGISSNYGAGSLQSSHKEPYFQLFVPSWVECIVRSIDGDKYDDERIDIDQRMLCVEALRYGATNPEFCAAFEAMAASMEGTGRNEKKQTKDRLCHWVANVLNCSWDPFIVAGGYIGAGI